MFNASRRRRGQFALPREENFQFRELFSTTVRFALGVQPFDDLGEQRHRPLAVERLVWTRLGGGGDLKLRVGGLPVKGQRRHAAAAFLAARFVHSLMRKCFSDASRKARKRPRSRSGRRDNFFQESARRSLGQIFGVFLCVAAAADVGVERKPVGAAQFLQRLVGLRRGTFASGEHDRPVRRGKDIARAVETGVECSEVKAKSFYILTADGHGCEKL